MEQKSKMEEDMKNMTSIVKKVLDVDIHSKKRFREIVDARMIFSKVMYEQGYNICSIARFLGKNHATVIYYIKLSDHIFTSYPELHDKYMVCSEVFSDGKEPSMTFTRKDMIRSINTLNEKVRVLTYERNVMKRRQESVSRFMEIISLLENRIAEGSEQDAYKKINKALNGNYV